MKHLLFLGLFCAFLIGNAAVVFSAESGATPKPPPATYVGNEVCKACHPTQFEKFSQTVMGKIFLFNARNETERQACENCHGPGSNHVAAGGGKGVGGLITFRKDTGESVQVQNQTCLSVISGAVQTYWAASPHASRGMAASIAIPLWRKPPISSSPRLARRRHSLPARANRSLRSVSLAEKRSTDALVPYAAQRRKAHLHRLPQPARHAQSFSAQTGQRERELLHLSHGKAWAVSLDASSGVRELHQLP